MNVPQDAYDTTLSAQVNGPVVVIIGAPNIAVAMTPQAVLDSLDSLKAAADEALRNLRAGIEPDAGF